MGHTVASLSRGRLWDDVKMLQCDMNVWLLIINITTKAFPHISCGIGVNATCVPHPHKSPRCTEFTYLFCQLSQSGSFKLPACWWFVHQRHRLRPQPFAEMSQKWVISTKSSKMGDSKKKKRGCLTENKISFPLTRDFIYIKVLGSVTWKSLARTRVQSVARGGPLCTMVIENKDGQNLMLLK